MWERLKATGRAIKHRRLTFALVLLFLTVGVVGGLYAIQQDAQLNGQITAGDHDFWADADYEAAAFCSNCHFNIAAELVNTEHAGGGACVGCHAVTYVPDPNNPGESIAVEHLAAAGACTDCHNDDALRLEATDEAHNGIMASLGESPTDAGRSCQACHTHAEVSMTVTAPSTVIDLVMDG